MTADPGEVAVSALGVVTLLVAPQTTKRRPVSHSRDDSIAWFHRGTEHRQGDPWEEAALSELPAVWGGGSGRPGSLPGDLESWECACPGLGGCPVLLDVSCGVFEGPNSALAILLQVH